MRLTKASLAKMIDNTLLEPAAAKRDLVNFCEQASEYHFASVCVLPYWAQLCSEILRGSDVKVCVPVGFPFGTCPTLLKLLEAKSAIAAGATEIGIVVNLGALKSRQYGSVRKDIEDVIRLTKLAGLSENNESILTEVILEIQYLGPKEIQRVCEFAVREGVEFAKTSTGFGASAISVEEIRRVRKAVGNELGVKAAGNIRTMAEAIKLLDAGASRIGTSYGCEIVEEAPPELEEKGKV